MLEVGSLPPTLTQASIILHLKKDKDPTLFCSYRPTSLLNLDVKVQATFLATRLEKLLPRIVSEEQNGFITRWHVFFNTFDLIYSQSQGRLPEVVIFLIAEKVFKTVEWEYHFTVLETFGYGEVNFLESAFIHLSPCLCTY